MFIFYWYKLLIYIKDLGYNVDYLVLRNDLYKVYGYVYIIVFFIGYLCSCYSFLGLLMDVYLCMVVFDERMVFNVWRRSFGLFIDSLIYKFYDIMFYVLEKLVFMGRWLRIFEGNVMNKVLRYGYMVLN